MRSISVVLSLAFVAWSSAVRLALAFWRVLYARRKEPKSSILGVFALLFFGFGGGVLMVLGARFLLMPHLTGKTIGEGAGCGLVGDVEAMVFL
jgi:hypothetical protein